MIGTIETKLKELLEENNGELNVAAVMVHVRKLERDYIIQLENQSQTCKDRYEEAQEYKRKHDVMIHCSTKLIEVVSQATNMDGAFQKLDKAQLALKAVLRGATEATKVIRDI